MESPGNLHRDQQNATSPTQRPTMSPDATSTVRSHAAAASQLPGEAAAETTAHSASWASLGALLPGLDTVRSSKKPFPSLSLGVSAETTAKSGHTELQSSSAKSISQTLSKKSKASSHPPRRMSAIFLMAAPNQRKERAADKVVSMPDAKVTLTSVAENCSHSRTATTAVSEKISGNISMRTHPGAVTGSSGTVSPHTPAPNRTAAVCLSITTVILIITIAFLYIRPHFSRGVGLLSRSTTAGDHNARGSGPHECVDASGQLAVQLADGTIYGKPSSPAHASEPYVRLFFGIRYAASTAGSRRFGAAVASTPWDVNGTFHAHQHGPPCVQMSPTKREPVGSEDCLTLSIWSPFLCRPTDLLKTVVVTLSNDWFQTGHVADYQDSWRRMAAYGDVVVVALNVRLGVTGYLRTPMEEAPGNVAFTDVAVALSWIHSNVGAFYGDPTQMVAVGLGGGGLLLATDLFTDRHFKSYFKRFVLHGLSPTSLLPRNDVADARLLAERLACPVGAAPFTGDTLRCLKNSDPKMLVKASQMVGNVGFVPSRDVEPLSFGISGKNFGTRPLAGVSVLCGYSLRDALAHVDDVVSRNNVTQEGVKPSEMMARAARLFGRSNRTSGGASLADGAKTFLAGMNRSGIVRLLVDAIYDCPLLELTSAATMRGAVAFFYVYTGFGLFEPVLNMTELMKFVKTGALPWVPFGIGEDVVLFNNTGEYFPSGGWRNEICLKTREIVNAFLA